jgi:hypothetical protein
VLEGTDTLGLTKPLGKTGVAIRPIISSSPVTPSSLLEAVES